MKLHELSPAYGASKKCKRLGRGSGSGTGKTSGKGHKGQNARSGGGVRPGFEGGQMPLHRRIPKRGFTNIFAKKYAIVNLEKLNVFQDGAVVDEALLRGEDLVRGRVDGIKVLGKGEINKKITIKVNCFSETAKQKIEQAGGKAEVI